MPSRGPRDGPRSWCGACVGGLSRCLRQWVFRRPIEDDDFFALNLWQKFVQYRIVPVKLLLNLLIISLLVTFVERYQLFANTYVINSRYGLTLALLQPADPTDQSLTVKLSTIDAFQTFLSQYVTGYYTLPAVNSGLYMHFARGALDARPLAPVLEMTYTDSATGGATTASFELLQEDPLGPFGNISSLMPLPQSCEPQTDVSGRHIVPCRNGLDADFFDRLQSLRLTSRVRGVVSNPSGDYSSVMLWDLTTTFAFRSHNTDLEAKTAINFRETQRLIQGPVLLALGVLVPTLWAVVLRLYFFLRHFGYVAVAKTPAHAHRYRVARAWTVFGLVADFCTLFFCAVVVASSFLGFVDQRLSHWRSVAVGSAAFLQCVLVLSHFQNVPRMYLIAQSITTALPHLSLYLVSVFPIFFGFTLCATAGFGGVSSLFASLPQAMVTLFCMICGDSLLYIYTDANQTAFSALQVFTVGVLGIFLFVFICNILNIALAIVQDSYNYVRDLHDLDERVIGGLRRAEMVRAHRRAVAQGDVAAAKTLLRQVEHVSSGAAHRHKAFSRDEIDRLRQRFTVADTDESSSDDAENK